jgi:hypothetical protein
MRKLLVATGVAVATATTMANAVEVGGVKITPNVEVGWQRGARYIDSSGVVSDGSNSVTYTSNEGSRAKTEFQLGQAGLEVQYKNYFGGIKYTHDRIKGTANRNIIYSDGDTYSDSFNYVRILERYLVYAGYQFNLNNVELRPYTSLGFYSYHTDKGNFVGLGLTGKINLPYGFGIFASTEYDKIFNGKYRLGSVTNKDIKDIWEVSAGISKKINFAEIYLKTYYREHNASITEVYSYGYGITDTSNTNIKYKISGIMIGLNF